MADGLTVSVERVEAVGAEAILLHLLLTDGEHEEHRTCTVLPEIYAAQSFSVGPISREDYRVILRAEELSTAIKKGMQMLAFSDASFAGIVRKLMQKGTDEKTARSAARYLRAKGYIREQDAVLRAADECLRKLWGPQRILAKLYRDGYDDDALYTAKAYIEEMDLVGNCVSLIRKKTPSVPEDRELRRKLCASLLRFGYSQAQITEAFRRLSQETEI